MDELFDVKNFFKRWPAAYNMIKKVFGPVLFGGLSPKKFLKKYRATGEKLNLGSGPNIISSEVKNVDIYPFKGVDLVADISQLPFGDNSVNQIICDNVLEHVSQPVLVVSEIYRVLASGGTAYISTPFLYPFHSSPHDYYRWTDDGLKQLFINFEFLEIGVRCGPFSALTANLIYLFSTILCFGSKKLFWLLTNLLILIFFPLKLPDILFNYLPVSKNMAAALFCVIRKK